MPLSRSMFISLALSLSLGAAPASPTDPAPARQVARRDATFVVPESVTAQLSLVSDMAVSSDDRVFVSDARLPTVFELEPSGSLRRTIGRSGGGPGEFYAVAGLGFRGDSLWATDAGLNRVSLFPLNGAGRPLVIGLAGVVPRKGTRLDAYAVRGHPEGIMSDGTMLVMQQEGDPSAPASSQVMVFRTGRDLAILDTLGVMPMQHALLHFVWPQGASFMSQPFSDMPIFHAAANGSVVAQVDRTAPAAGGATSFQVTVWDARGTRLFTRDIEYRPRRIRGADVDQAMARFTNPAARLPGPVTVDSIRRKLYRPDFFPPVREVHIGRDRTIWLLVNFADSPATDADWLVLSPRGFPLARVSTPPDLRVMEADRHTLWGVEGDPEDVPVLARYLVEG